MSTQQQQSNQIEEYRSSSGEKAKHISSYPISNIEADWAERKDREISREEMVRVYNTIIENTDEEINKAMPSYNKLFGEHIDDFITSGGEGFDIAGDMTTKSQKRNTNKYLREAFTSEEVLEDNQFQSVLKEVIFDSVRENSSDPISEEIEQKVVREVNKRIIAPILAGTSLLLFIASAIAIFNGSVLAGLVILPLPAITAWYLWQSRNL